MHPRVTARWAVGRGGRVQAALHFHQQPTPTCPPKTPPRHNSSNLRPCHPTGRHQLLKHSKRFRCLCFSSSQLCLLANANLHLNPRSAPSSNIHQLPEVCPQLSGAKIALQIGHCCASRKKEKLSENLLFSWLVSNFCISLCHGSHINYHKMRKGFIQPSSESLGKELKLISFYFLRCLSSKSHNSQKSRSKNMTHSNFPWFNFLKLTNLIAIFTWYLQLCLLTLFPLLKPAPKSSSLSLSLHRCFQICIC